MSSKFPDGVFGHTVSMTLSRESTSASRAPIELSVATCQCGWCSKLPRAQFRRQARAIEAHWKQAKGVFDD